MLASQLTAVSRASNFPRQASTASLRSCGVCRGSECQVQQLRSFRFGLWSSYLDPVFQKEIQRRHRIVKHKYAAALNRKLSWDPQLPSHQTNWSLKSFVYSAWRGQDPRPGGRWVNVDELKNTSRDDKISKNPNIEEFEQRTVDSMGRVFGRHNARIIEDFIRQSRGSFGRGWNSEPTSPFSTTASPKDPLKPRVSWTKAEHAAANVSSDPEYDIDPISNRKVYKKTRQPSSDESTDIPVKTFEGYRSQFTKFEPPDIKNLAEEVKHYKSVTYNKPDRQHTTQPDLIQEALKDYDSKYSNDKAHMFNTHLDGQLPMKPDLVKEALAEYDQTQSYDKPHYFNEHLDGQLPVKPDLVKKALADYDKTQSYDQPHYFNEHLDGQLPAQPDLVDESLKDYDSQHPYNEPHYFNEHLDGQLLEQPDIGKENLKDYNRNHEYQPFFYNHPDGHGAQQEEALFSDHNHESAQPTRKKPTWVFDINKQDDVDLLRASDVRSSSGIIKGAKKETEVERQNRRMKLDQDFSKPERVSADEFAAAKKVQDTRRLAQELEIERSELLNLEAHARGQVNAKITELEAEAEVAVADKSAGKKLTGNFVRDFPEEFSATWTKKGLSYSLEQDNAIQIAENEYAEQVSSKEWQSPGSKTTRLETAMDRKLKEEVEIDPYSKVPKGLETCYAEEVAANGGPKPLFQTSYGYGPNKDAKMQRDKNEDRKRQKELVREVRSIYEDRYGTIDCQHRQVREEVATKAAASKVDKPKAAKIEPQKSSQEPTLYKILAYDPTMQEINIAETTSIVPDSSGALTPAEVLLRLSQPSKFFPHFKSLQAQGYEIVSGSGDVLVFRKVRDGSPPTKVFQRQDSARISKHTHGGRPINPVDGMKHIPQPASANFASPTGFVGEPLRMDDEPEEPKFKSNIDVRREEAVFSGRDNGWQKGDRKPKRTFKKFLVGAAWVAGCSYAVGVVAEFFRTGGSDGLGTVGF